MTDPAKRIKLILSGTNTPEDDFDEIIDIMEEYKNSNKEIPRSNEQPVTLIKQQYEESYYLWYKCPNCRKEGLSEKDRYCSRCGVRIQPPTSE